MKTLRSLLSTLSLPYKNMWVGRNKFWLSMIVILAILCSLNAYTHALKISSAAANVVLGISLVSWFVLAPCAIAFLDCRMDPSRVRRLVAES